MHCVQDACVFNERYDPEWDQAGCLMFHHKAVSECRVTDDCVFLSLDCMS